MKNFIYFLFILLIMQSCAVVEPEGKGKSSTTSEKKYNYQYRWIDNLNVMDLIDFSSTSGKISHTDIYEKLGEPVYVEKLYITDKDEVEQNTVLFWYKYKSKIYPVAEQETITTKKVIIDPMGGIKTMTKVDTSEYLQMKPELVENHNRWEDNHKWLVVVMFDDTFELVLSDDLGQSYGLYRDFYSLSNAGHFEGKDNKNILDQIKDVIDEAISKLNSK